MSAIDDLLDRSRAPGTFVERRTFSLARDKAIEKMREFALRNPNAASVEIIQAANLASARFIAVESTRSELVIAWLGGRPITPDQLGALFDHLFLSQADARRRHLLQLAVGVNGLLQRRPALLRVESGDGTSKNSACLEIRGRDRLVLGRPEDPIHGTYVYARFRVNVLDRLSPDQRGVDALHVHARARLSPAPILVNGEAPIGMCPEARYDAFFGARTEPFHFGPIRGALAVGPGLDRVEILIGGVRVARRSLYGAALGGIIAWDELRKTADMSDIVEDDRWAELLHTLLPVARKLLGRRFSPRDLPPRPRRRKKGQDQAEGDGPAIEAVPDPVVQLGLRAELPREALLDPAEHHPEEPLFYVHPEDSSTIEAAADLAVFPYRVLVLSAGQARGLARQIPRLSRLAQPQDTTFVRQAIERGARVLVHRVSGGPLTRLFPTRAGEDRAQLIVRLHLRGLEPRYDLPGQPPGVPLVIVHEGRARACGRLPLGLAHVSAELRLPATCAPADALTEGAIATMNAATRAALASLAPQALLDESRGPTVARHLLETFLRATFERPDGGGPARLALHLPDGWGEVRDQLLDAPLAPTSDGPLTTRRLAELQGTDSFLRLTDPQDRERLGPLCDRLGHGHLVEPDDVAPLAMVARTGQSWQPVVDPIDLGEAEELLAARASFAPLPLIDGWRALPDPAPTISHWVRIDAEPTATDDPPPRSARTAGLTALAAAIEALRHSGLAALVDRRPADLALLAALHLARLTGQPGGATLTDAAGRSRRVAALLDDPSLRAIPRGGITSAEPGVLTLPLDALLALDALRQALGLERPVPLLGDDDPTAWATAPPAAWLVREPIDTDGLTGWLALPRSFDPTPTVFVEAAGHLDALSAITTGAPCCGLLTLHGAPRLTEPHRRAIRLGARRLYELLLPLLAQPVDPVTTASANAYAGRWITTELLTRPHAPLDGLLRALADRVRLPDPHAAWTLLRWAEADPASRPRLPASWTHDVPTRPTTAPIHADDTADQALARPVADELSLRLHRPTRLRIERIDGETAHIAASAAGPQVIRVLIPEFHVRWNDGLRGDALARLRAQLWLVGLLARALEPEGYRVDQGAMAMGLVAAIR